MTPTIAVILPKLRIVELLVVSPQIIHKEAKQRRPAPMNLKVLSFSSNFTIPFFIRSSILEKANTVRSRMHSYASVEQN
jgi:hypothetical protein